MGAALKVRSVSLDDLEGQTADIVREAQEHEEPVMLTRGGNMLAIVLSPGVFKRLWAEADRVALQRAVEQADAAMDRGEYVSGDEVMAELDRWATGEV